MRTYIPEDCKNIELCEKDRKLFDNMMISAVMEIEERLQFVRFISQFIADEPDDTYVTRLGGLVEDVESRFEQFREENGAELLRRRAMKERDNLESAQE